MKSSFIRYGGLSPIKQEGFGSTTFHSPPARKGFYAFPQGGVEMFLLGKDVFDPRRMVKIKKSSELKKVERANNQPDTYSRAMSVWKNEKAKRYFDDNFNKMSKEEVEDYREKYEILVRHVSPKKFDYRGNLWHHLEEYMKDAAKFLKRRNDWVLTTYEDWLPAFRKALHYVKIENYSKDHLEVFIERL